MTEGPLSLYRARRGQGTIRPDPDQALAAEKFQSLYQALKGYRPQPGGEAKASAGGWLDRFGLGRRRASPPPELASTAPQGLYLYGGVGRGKSMLMDLFFETAPVEHKRRVHFHEFMLEVHQRIHDHRQSGKVKAGGADDSLPELARALAGEAWLLCFDEFHVTNVVDAMILGRLFTHLFDLGVVVVATSNWPPDMLYKDGLQRDLFLPFIALLKEKLDVLSLDGPTDYRLDRMKGMPIYHHPLGPASDAAMKEAFAALTGGAAGEATHLLVQGRRVEIERAAKGVAWVDFWDLCGKPFGAADYLAIATHFQTVLIDDVPTMKDDLRNEAKRFMTLVDALYEHKVNIVVAAAGPPERLYPEGTHAFEFERTVSRLMEMQSEDYLKSPHLP